MMNAERLALGTVQFGLKYGINNKAGQVSYEDMSAILTFAVQQGIDCLDTAEAYGDAETRLGEFMRAHPGTKFNLISKYNYKGGEMSATALKNSLQRLSVPGLYGYLAHDFKPFARNKPLIEQFVALKNEAPVSKIGFSLYFPSDLDFLLDNKILFDLVQLPFNIFDQRFAPYFERLQQAGIEIHTRSCFLQGLFFMDPQTLPVKLLPLREKLARLRSLSQETGLSLETLSLGFCLSHAAINKVVVGVDNLLNLKNNLESAATTVAPAIIASLSALTEDNENLILPLNW